MKKVFKLPFPQFTIFLKITYKVRKYFIHTQYVVVLVMPQNLFISPVNILKLFTHWFGYEVVELLN